MSRLVTLVLALLALAAPASAHAAAAHAAAARVPAPTFGADVNRDFLNQVRGIWTAAQTQTLLTSLYVAGGRVARADTDWQDTEPHRPVRGHHRYSWGYDDLIVSELAQSHLRWQPDLDYTPTWARKRGPDRARNSTGQWVVTPMPPAKNADFGAYAAAFARRYGPRGSFWTTHRSLPYEPVTSFEVWNEEDEALSWGPQVDLQHYVAMYEVVRSAIHRVDRHAEVVTGGVAWTKTSLPRLLKALRRKPVDAVAFHPYAATPNGTIALARYAIAQMKKYGRGRTPLLANEYGWTATRRTWGSTAPKHVDPYSYQALVGLSRLHLQYVLPFQWTDASWGLTDGTYGRALRQVRHR